MSMKVTVPTYEVELDRVVIYREGGKWVVRCFDNHTKEGVWMQHYPNFHDMMIDLGSRLSITPGF